MVGSRSDNGRWGALIDVKGGQHRNLGPAHAGDVWGVAGAVSAAVLVSDGGGGEPRQADGGEVPVLAWPHRGERERGGEHGGDG